MSSEKTEQTARTSESSSSLPSYLTEEEKKMDEDYEWCLNDPEVQKQYAGQVVAAHERHIWGAGRNWGDALDAALKQPGCPPKKYLVLVVVPYPFPMPSAPSSSTT